MRMMHVEHRTCQENAGEGEAAVSVSGSVFGGACASASRSIVCCSCRLLTCTLQPVYLRTPIARICLS
jgi:hypothetical protein